MNHRYLKIINQDEYKKNSFFQNVENVDEQNRCLVGREWLNVIYIISGEKEEKKFICFILTFVLFMFSCPYICISTPHCIQL